MDVERTMQFILDQQAEAAVFQARAERQLEAIRKLVQTGMRMLVKHDEFLQRHEKALDRHEKALDRHEKMIERGDEDRARAWKAIKELTDAQKRNERNIDRFIQSLRKGRNGGR